MRAVLLLACFVAACGNVGTTPPDAALPQPDAAAPAGGTRREIVPGGGRVTGGDMTFDVQFGHPVTQAPAGGGGMTIEGAAAVKP